MTNSQKADYLYREAVRYKQAGHLLLHSELLKLADHHGRMYIKESLSCSSKKEKRAVIEKPERKSEKHPGLKKKEGSSYKSAGVLQQAWQFASNNPLLSTMGRGAGLTAGGALVAAPAAAYFVNREADNLMGKVKDYAVPAALAVAGLGAAAYNYGPKLMQGTSDMASQAGNKVPSFRVPPRKKVAKVIASTRLRQKVAAAFGEDSQYMQDCDTALSRILFEVDDAT